MLSIYEANMNTEEKKETVEVEVVEEQQEELFKEEPRVEPVEVEVQENSEQREHVNDSKKRIDRLTKKMREAERREQDAIAFAQAKMAENDELKNQLQGLDKEYVTEYGQRVESELVTAKENLRKAMSVGDTDAAVDAQEKIASLMVAKEKASQARVKVDKEETAETPQQAQAQPTNQAPPVQRPDPKAEEWAEKNEWFGSDKIMTSAAFQAHNDLVEQGFDAESDEYYNEIDKVMRENFPHKFNQQQEQKKPVQTVASAQRNQSGRRSVKLTKSQIVIAKKLGVPLEEYAKYVKENANG